MKNEYRFCSKENNLWGGKFEGIATRLRSFSIDFLITTLILCSAVQITTSGKFQLSTCQGRSQGGAVGAAAPPFC